jgi:DNA methylase
MKPTNRRRSASNKPNLSNKAKKAKQTAVKSRQSQCRRSSAYDRLREPLAEAGATLIQGDSRLKMAEMEENSIDAIVTDPPYGLTEGPLDIEELLGEWMAGGEHKSAGSGFMGKKWDSTVPSPALWREALRALKPGGHCLAFAGTRTAHLTTLALQLAGFEIRDVLIWHYGQGMPKSRNIGHHLGHDSGTAVGSGLKPSYEPIIVARKPLQTGLTLTTNARQWGTGGINIDATRIGTTQTSVSGPSGRWPTNALFSHTDECRLLGREEVVSGAHAPGQRMSGFGRFGGGKVVACGDGFSPGRETAEKWDCAPGCPVAALDEQQGNTPSRHGTGGVPRAGMPRALARGGPPHGVALCRIAKLSDRHGLIARHEVLLWGSTPPLGVTALREEDRRSTPARDRRNAEALSALRPARVRGPLASSSSRNCAPSLSSTGRRQGSQRRLLTRRTSRSRLVFARWCSLIPISYLDLGVGPVDPCHLL